MRPTIEGDTDTKYPHTSVHHHKQPVHALIFTRDRLVHKTCEKKKKMAEGVLLSPTFPPGAGSMNPAMLTGGGGFDRVRKTMIRKTVDYHCSVLRYLEVCGFLHECVLRIYLCFVFVVESSLAER